MIIKVGQKKQLVVKALLKTDPSNEVKLPDGLDVFWVSDKPFIASVIDDKKGNVEITGIKKGKATVSVNCSKNSNLFSERFVDSIEVEVQDDSKPDEPKTGIISVVIKEKT